MKQSWSDEFLAFVVFVEIILLSSALGYFFRDWYVFAAILIGLLITSVIPILDIILALILSLSWGIIGSIIGQSFYNLESINDVSIDLIMSSFSKLSSKIKSIEDISINLIISLFSTPPSQVLGGILLLIGLVYHLTYRSFFKEYLK